MSKQFVCVYIPNNECFFNVSWDVNPRPTFLHAYV